MRKMEVIPVVNVTDWSEARERIKKVEPYTRRIKLDIADGTFTPNILWHNPADLKGLKVKSAIEVHLMIKNPEAAIDAWIEAGVKRIIVHVEAMENYKLIKEKCDKAGVDLMLAITPEVSWKWLLPYIENGHRSFQVLSVHPGATGQQFIEGNPAGGEYVESSYEKIRHLRDHCPTCDIEVDGGIKVGIAKKCREAGANLFAVGWAIFSAPDTEAAIKALKDDIA
ncbi:MAG: hypothetical protein HYT39_03110 [Candidatus Sungbacteria bacterium]|nr:hypothetical protein [Candidatus Sungbacteria bacterium]